MLLPLLAHPPPLPTKLCLCSWSCFRKIFIVVSVRTPPAVSRIVKAQHKLHSPQLRAKLDLVFMPALPASVWSELLVRTCGVGHTWAERRGWGLGSRTGGTSWRRLFARGCKATSRRRKRYSRAYAPSSSPCVGPLPLSTFNARLASYNWLLLIVGLKHAL